jgi:beta-glucanase (GH16 family)
MGNTPLMAEPPEGWKLVFNDEFSGGELDVAKWNTTMAFAGIHGPRYHNEFYLSYTMDDDIIVGDDVLRLRTERRTVEGAEAPGKFEYTQGLVTSHDKFSFTHGYIEIRAKFPGGKGLWPCLWLMPQHQGWPPEFDIAEYYSTSRTMHHGLAYGPLANMQWDSTRDAEHEHEDGWHLYALEWMPGRAVWSVDCIPRKTVLADYVPDVPMYVVLSNSVSSRVGVSGEPDATTVFPNDLQIDYVRIYQPAPAVKPALVVADNKVPEGKTETPKPVETPVPDLDQKPVEDEALE